MADQPDPVDEKVKSLAGRAVSSVDAGTIEKIVVGVLVALWGWYMKRQLDARDAKLAEVQAQLMNDKMAAQQAYIKSQSKVLSDQENLALQQAQAKLQEIKAREAALEAVKQEHADRVERVEKLTNWNDLNKLAGIS